MFLKEFLQKRFLKKQVIEMKEKSIPCFFLERFVQHLCSFEERKTERKLMIFLILLAEFQAVIGNKLFWGTQSYFAPFCS